MQRTMKQIYQLLIIGGISGLLLILSLATPVVLSSSDFSVYNPGWNGCSNLGIRAYKAGKLQPTLYLDQNELTINQQSFTEYALVASESVIVLIGPQEPLSAEEIMYLKQFLDNGGRVLLADDFGYGNQILQEINATTRLSSQLLLDLSFDKNASFVTIYNFPLSTHPIVANISTLLVNYPTSIQKGEDTKVLAQSSAMSWLDHNENGIYDPNEQTGPYPILATETIGNGEIVVLATPSILINSMAKHHNNQIFRENLFSYIFTDRSTVIFDESHRAIASPLQITYFFPSVISLEIKIAILLLIIGLFITWFTPLPQLILVWLERLLLRKQSKPQRYSSEHIVNELINRHPSWDRNKVKDFIERMEHS